MLPRQGSITQLVMDGSHIEVNMKVLTPVLQILGHMM